MQSKDPDRDVKVKKLLFANAINKTCEQSRSSRQATTWLNKKNLCL